MQSVKQAAVPVFDFHVDAKAGQYFKLGPDMSFVVVTPRAKNEKLPGLVGAIKRESIAVVGEGKAARLEVKREVLSGQARDGRPLMQRNELALNAAYNTSILRALQHYARQHSFEADANYIVLEKALSKREVLALPPADFANTLSGRIGKIHNALHASAPFDAAIDEALEKKPFTGNPDQVRARALTYLHEDRRRLEIEYVKEQARLEKLLKEGKGSNGVTVSTRNVSDAVREKADQYVAAAIRDLASLGDADSGDVMGASSASNVGAQQTFEEFRDGKLVRSQLAQLDGLRKFIGDRLPPGAALPAVAFEATEDSLGSSEFQTWFQPLERSVREFPAKAQATMGPYAGVLEQLTRAVIHDQESYLQLSSSVKGLTSTEVASMVDGLAKLTRQKVQVSEVQSRACAILLERNLQQRVPTADAPSKAQCFQALALAVEQMIQERTTPPGKELLDYGAVLEKPGCRLELKGDKVVAVGPRNAKVGINEMEIRYQYNREGFYDLPKGTNLTQAEIQKHRSANDAIVVALVKGLRDKRVPAETYAQFYEAASRAAQLPPRVFASQVAHAMRQVDDVLAQRRHGAMPPDLELAGASSRTSSSSLSSRSIGEASLPSRSFSSSQSSASEPVLEQSSQARRPGPVAPPQKK